ncbi:hypothetical protein [Streptomyces bohaiensis]|uniref:DUF3558 domain-containing protein n=1 Tax=Streptomyces bohaiensis TaxID=1431344 RepID=A0ABX1CG18_9ACTN|nr:hypothetical protein [Streptomyces bohaiensis]NJQ17291.1 hypothetical protein [Streptomyces bohaiensis]
MTERVRIFSVACIALLMSSTACSRGDDGEVEQSRSYDVPESLCGIEMPGVELDKLFPPGERIEERQQSEQDSERYGSFTCQYLVDRVPVLLVSGHFDVHGDIETPPWQSYAMRGDPGRESVAVEGDFEARAWPGAAGAVAQCPFDGELDPYYVSVVSMYPKDEDEAVEVVSELIQPAAAHAEEHCTASQPGAPG